MTCAQMRSRLTSWRKSCGCRTSPKTVMYLYYIEGYTSEEIADMLSISAAAVRKRLQYGRKKLRFELEEGGQMKLKGSEGI